MRDRARQLGVFTVFVGSSYDDEVLSGTFEEIFGRRNFPNRVKLLSLSIGSVLFGEQILTYIFAAIIFTQS